LAVRKPLVRDILERLAFDTGVWFFDVLPWFGWFDAFEFVFGRARVLKEDEFEFSDCAFCFEFMMGISGFRNFLHLEVRNVKDIARQESIRVLAFLFERGVFRQVPEA